MRGHKNQSETMQKDPCAFDCANNFVLYSKIVREAKAVRAQLC